MVLYWMIMCGFALPANKRLYLFLKKYLAFFGLPAFALYLSFYYLLEKFFYPDNL